MTGKTGDRELDSLIVSYLVDGREVVLVGPRTVLPNIEGLAGVFVKPEFSALDARHAYPDAVVIDIDIVSSVEEP